MDIKKVLTLIESAEQQQTLTEGKNMAKEMVMQHYTKQEIKTPIKNPVSRLNEYFKVVDNEMLNVIKEEKDAKRVEVKNIVNRVLERLDENKKAEAPKPRNFVAKNQQTSGAGAHKDKKKAEKQGDVKHKKQAVPMDESEQLSEKAVSKAQQKFMGMVHAAKKGEKPASKEVAKVAKGMSGKAAKDFASTKHKGLPDKKIDEVAGPEKCWPGHRKVGTQPGTGKNAGKRVNKCVKISEDAMDPDGRIQAAIEKFLATNPKNGDDLRAFHHKAIDDKNDDLDNYLSDLYDYVADQTGADSTEEDGVYDEMLDLLYQMLADKGWSDDADVEEKVKESIEVGSTVKVYSNVLKKPVLGTIVELKEGRAYVNYNNTKIVMGHPVEKVQLAEVAGLARFIPGVGLVAGGYDAYQRAKQGDYTGAALSAGAGLAGLVPGLGTAAATGLVGAQLARDKARTGSFLPSYDEIGSAGQKPQKPTGQSTTPTGQSATPTGGGYTIKKGDTLTKIAKANNTTIKDIMAANPQIKDPNKIFAGAKLNLPGQAAAPAAKPAATTQQAATPAEPAATATTAAPAAASGAVAAFGKSAAANAQPDVNAGGASVTDRKVTQQLPTTTKQGNVTTTTSGSTASGTLKGITQDMIANHPVYKAEMAKAAGKSPQQARMAQRVAAMKAKDAILRDPSYLQSYKAPAPVATGNAKIDNF